MIAREAVRNLDNSAKAALREKLQLRLSLSQLLGRRVNQELLSQTLCLLDGKAIARRRTENRNGKVKVYKL